MFNIPDRAEVPGFRIRAEDLVLWPETFGPFGREQASLSLQWRRRRLRKGHI